MTKSRFTILKKGLIASVGSAKLNTAHISPRNKLLLIEVHLFAELASEAYPAKLTNLQHIEDIKFSWLCIYRIECSDTRIVTS